MELERRGSFAAISANCVAKICAGLPGSIYSPESAAGSSPCGGPDGRQLDLFGPAPAPANRSAAPESNSPIGTTGTSGLKCSGSSASADLQRCLESRLRAVLGDSGSPEYALTWRRWDMPSGPPICALRASARRTSDSGCIGWPTPRVGVGGCTGTKYKGRVEDAAASVVGWATPCARDWRQSARSKQGIPRQAGTTSGWCDASSPPETAEAEKSSGVLNPEHTRWLQGFPAGWCDFADSATRSSRSSPQSSSEPSSIRSKSDE